MAGIKISIVDDVASFLRGTQRVEDALDDTADSLDDLARDAQRAGKDAGDDLAKGIDRGTDKATDAVDDMQRSFRDLAKGVQRESKQAGDDLGDNIRRGSRAAEDSVGRVGDAFKEAGDEAGSSAREAAASFSGEITDIADFAQETLANAFAGFGPIGAAAGLAAAAGLGALWTSITEGSDKAKDEIRSMYDDMLASGQSFLTNDAIQERIAEIVNGGEDAKVKYAEVQAQAELTGLSVQTMLLAWAGNQGAINEVQDRINDKLDETSSKLQSGELSGDEFAGLRYQLTDTADRLSGVTDQLGVAGDAAAVTRQSMNLLNREYADTPDGVSTDVNADTAPAHAKLDALGRRIDSTRPTIPVDAVGSLDMSQADREMDAWLRRPRTATVTPLLGQRAV